MTSFYLLMQWLSPHNLHQSSIYTAIISLHIMTILLYLVISPIEAGNQQTVFQKVRGWLSLYPHLGLAALWRSTKAVSVSAKTKNCCSIKVKAFQILDSSARRGHRKEKLDVTNNLERQNRTHLDTLKQGDITYLNEAFTKYHITCFLI